MATERRSPEISERALPQENISRGIYWPVEDISRLRRSVAMTLLIPTFYVGLPRWHPFRIISDYPLYKYLFHLFFQLSAGL
jgi:hypothetical protein